ncbi:MAG: DUF4153 domain-containing protein [Peptococcaceae bacterium]
MKNLQESSCSWSSKEFPASPVTLSTAASQEKPFTPPVKEPFKPDLKDAVFAVLVFLLGFLFARWVLFYWQGWGVTAFTVAYCSIITFYLLKKNVAIPREGWFWLTIVLLNGLSFSLWTNNGLEPWRSLLLFFSGVYWIICTTGLPLLGKTSNWIALDYINGLLFIPFKNLSTQYISLAILRKEKGTKKSNVFSVILGLLLAIIVGGMIIPLLIEADSGGFAKITNGILIHFQGIEAQLTELIFNGIIGIPIAAYIFALVAGSVHKRGCATFKNESIQKKLTSLRFIPAITIYTLLITVCGLYVVFIGSQMPYFFSAFFGERPEGWLVYSEYARSGFFELCYIAAINLSLLTAANLLNKKSPGSSSLLKILNCLLALLTLLLIATALSKMLMYIEVYGLSVRRLLPSLFLIFLAVICSGVVALQKWQFSILRLAAGMGAIMLCLLCLSNPDGFTARYNAGRYLAGTLPGFDVTILNRGGPAGVEAALQVYDKSDDPVLKEQLQNYLVNQQQRSEFYSGRSWDNWEQKKAREKTAELPGRFRLTP